MRGIADIELYVYGDSPAEMRRQAEEIARYINKQYDARAEVIGIANNDFGKHD